MNRIYVLPEDELGGGIYGRIFLLVCEHRGTWQAVGAAVGLFGGLLSVVLAVLIWAVVALFAPAGVPGSLLDQAGTALFILPLPLLALGAHCLDLLEKTNPRLSPSRQKPGPPSKVERVL
jgi:hypothetical protein